MEHLLDQKQASTKLQGLLTTLPKFTKHSVAVPFESVVFQLI